MTAERMVAYCHRRELLFPEPDAFGRYPWLAGIDDDLDLLDVLWRECGADEDEPSLLGIGSAVHGSLTRGVRALRRVCVGMPSAGLASAARAGLADRSTRFLGDVLAYLAGRGDREELGAIPAVVAGAVEQAAARSGPGHPLIVVAHSMGGDIVYDLFNHFRPDLTVDVLVTVGSQVGLFAELSLLRDVDPALPTAGQPRIRVPENIRSWINVVDPADLLGYRAEPIFDRVRDYRYPSSAPWAHSAYFRQPHFHARLADRVRQAMP